MIRSSSIIVSHSRRTNLTSFLSSQQPSRSHQNRNPFLWLAKPRFLSTSSDNTSSIDDGNKKNTYNGGLPVTMFILDKVDTLSILGMENFDHIDDEVEEDDFQDDYYIYDKLDHEHEDSLSHNENDKDDEQSSKKKKKKPSITALQNELHVKNQYRLLPYAVQATFQTLPDDIHHAVSFHYRFNLISDFVDHAKRILWRRPMKQKAEDANNVGSIYVTSFNSGSPMKDRKEILKLCKYKPKSLIANSRGLVAPRNVVDQIRKNKVKQQQQQQQQQHDFDLVVFPDFVTSQDMALRQIIPASRPRSIPHTTRRNENMSTVQSTNVQTITATGGNSGSNVTAVVPSTRKDAQKERGYVLIPLLVQDLPPILMEEPTNYSYGNSDKKVNFGRDFENLQIIKSLKSLEKRKFCKALVYTFHAIQELNSGIREAALKVIELREEVYGGRPLPYEELPLEIQQTFRFPSRIPKEVQSVMIHHVLEEVYSSHFMQSPLFKVLVQYQNREGHCHVPYDYWEEETIVKKDGITITEKYPLGRWVYKQQKFLFENDLEYGRRRLLEALGVPSIQVSGENAYNDHDEDREEISTEEQDPQPILSPKITFEQYLQQAQQYKDQNENCRLMPADYVQDGIPLGEWVQNQLFLQQNKLLCEAQQHKFGEVFGSTFLSGKWHHALRQNQRVESYNSFKENFAVLEEFHSIYGHCNVLVLKSKSQKQPNQQQHTVATTRYLELAPWVSRQRRLKKKGHLIQLYKNMLDRLDFIWDVNKYEWNTRFEILRLFKEEHGHANVPIGYSVTSSTPGPQGRFFKESSLKNSFNLQTWLARQKMEKKKGTLDAEYEEKLEKLGVAWNIKHDIWEAHLEVLRQFKDREGHMLVSHAHKEKLIRNNGEGNLTNAFDPDLKYVNLGAWVQKNRNEYKKGIILPHRQQALEDMGMVWDVEPLDWRKSYNALKKYRDIHGHVEFHLEEMDGIKLHQFVKLQRKKWREESLCSERKALLDDLGIVWDTKDAAWERMFKVLKKFKEREGHVNIPNVYCEGDDRLGFWLAYQRRNYAKGELMEHRIEKLEELGVILGKRPSGGSRRPKT